MTIDEMLAGEWRMLVEETPTHLAPTLTFAAGQVSENGLPVGAYRFDRSRLEVTMGNDVNLIASLPDLRPLLPGIEPLAVNVLSATMTTQIPDDEPMIECATLARVIADRLPDSELRDRLAA